MEQHRYFINMAYAGTAYHGWQIQPNAIGVQELLQDALSLLLRTETVVTGAGRTDTGVHAPMFCAHFDSGLTPDEIHRMQLSFRLNRILPPDIVVHDIIPVRPDAHARFSAINRTYAYYLATEKDPFKIETSWLFERKLDLETMQEAARRLSAHEDFACFARSGSQVRTTNCTIYKAAWTREHHMLIFEIQANRFLRNMVRALVGTMVDAGLGKISPDEFEGIILSRNRSKAGRSAPAQGLHLTGIEYPDDIFLR